MLSLLLLASTAWPCAGLFHEDGKLAESDNQEVILEQTEDGVRAHYRVIYKGDSESFGWVIAIPGAFSALEDGDLDLFAAVGNVSAPYVIWNYAESEAGCGCMGASKGDNSLGGGLDSAAGGVEVIAEGFTGTYEYVILSATDSSELLTWLSDNGWSAGSSESEIEAYVADGWQFAALKVAPDSAQTAEEGRELPPVAISYAGEMSYPARMALHASMDEQRTTLYVLGDQQARISEGWSQGSLSEMTGEIYEDTPETLFEEALREIGGDTAGYALTFSGAYEDRWLTRFDTVANREVHTVDPVLVVDAGQTEHSVVITMNDPDLEESGSSRSSSRALLLAPFFLGLGWSARRRR